MFNELIESKRKRDANAGGTLASVIVHVVVVALAVVVSAHAGQQVVEERRAEDIKFVEVQKAEEPPPPEEAPPPPPPVDAPVTPPPPQGFQVLAAPIDIPDKIPEVDLSKAVTDEADFSGRGVAGGIAKGVVGGTAPVVQDQPYFEFQVERQVVVQTRREPRFPQMLADRGQTGEVLVQFVVTPEGRVDMSTLKVLSSSNELFTREVRAVLPHWRFLPAEVGGRKVAQYVQLPITFALAN
jgi:periplasmic protein TonB